MAVQGVAGASRLDCHATGRIVRRLAKHAGITKLISPHSLRHAAITAALNAGVSLRDVQEFARHADPRQTRRDDRQRLGHNSVGTTLDTYASVLPAVDHAKARSYARAILGGPGHQRDLP